MNNIVLNDQQEKIKNKAVHWFLHESSQVFEIDGAAGTGKTVLIKEILKALNLKATDYYAMAYTGQAALVMRTRGFTNARSIHSTLYEVEETFIDPEDEDSLAAKFGVRQIVKKFHIRRSIPENVRLFFIDEAYMVPQFMVKQILNFQVKVIVAGDAHQLPPIGDNPGFLINPGVHHLTQLMRQSENSPIVYLANRAMHNEVIHCGMYGNDVMVIEDKEFIPQMVGFADCICCGTNMTRDMMNKYIRSLAGYRGQMPHCGERIICRKNNWETESDGIALTNGLAGVIMNNPDIPKGTDTNNVFHVDFKPDIGNTLFLEIPVNYNYFVASSKEKNFLKESTSSRFLKGNFFDYAYCLTTHLCQGSEYNNGVVLEEYLRYEIQAQLIYTGITRFKNKLIFVKKTNKYIYIPGMENTGVQNNF